MLSSPGRSQPLPPRLPMMTVVSVCWQPIPRPKNQWTEDHLHCSSEDLVCAASSPRNFNALCSPCRTAPGPPALWLAQQLGKGSPGLRLLDITYPTDVGSDYDRPLHPSGCVCFDTLGALIPLTCIILIPLDRRVWIMKIYNISSNTSPQSPFFIPFMLTPSQITRSLNPDPFFVRFHFH